MRTLLLALLILSAATTTVRAADNPSREAAKHFQRGVDLYNDGDFRGALVEFKKAYSTWPRANVLYDIGQTEYQLLDYAAALRTMERYLAETGPTAPHRQDVETSVEVLRGRVGRVALSSESGCDVTVDDQPAGTTPLDAPILVSVGQRRFNVSCPGQRSAAKRVEVAAGETVPLELRPAPLPATVARATTAARETKPSEPGKGYLTGWIISGVLVGGTIALGATTLVEQGKLSAMKSQYPVAKADLDRQGTLTTGLAIGSDILGVASVVAAGVSTYLTVKHYRYEHNKHVRVGLSMSGVQVGGTF
jgi:hypothetical protein